MLSKPLKRKLMSIWPRDKYQEWKAHQSHDLILDKDSIPFDVVVEEPISKTAMVPDPAFGWAPHQDFPGPSDRLEGHLIIPLANLPTRRFSRLRMVPMPVTFQQWGSRTGEIFKFGKRVWTLGDGRSQAVRSWKLSIALQQLEIVRFLAIGDPS